MIEEKKMKYHKYWKKFYFVYFSKILFKFCSFFKKQISLSSMNFVVQNFTNNKKYRDYTFFFSKNIDFEKVFNFPENFPPKIEIDCVPFGNVFFEVSFSSNFAKNSRIEEFYSIETKYNFWHGFISFKKIILLHGHKLKKGDTFSTIIKINKINFLESYFIEKILVKTKIPERNQQFLFPVLCFSPGLGHEQYYKNGDFFSKNFSFFSYYKIEFKIILRKKSSIRVAFGPEFRYNEREN